MRLIHISDLHLGFRQYQRQTPIGVNQREWDVAMAFKRAIDKIIEVAPDIVLIAGDVFLAVRDALKDHPVLDPDPAAKHNVLCIHCELTGVLPADAVAQERSTVEITVEEIAAS